MSDYDEDEWYSEDYEPECMFMNARLYKKPNGHLYIEEVTAWAYAEHEVYDSYFWHWVTERESLKAYVPYARQLMIEAGKKLKPGQCVELDEVFPDDDYDEDYEDKEEYEHE